MKYFIDLEFIEGTQKEKFPISLFRKNTKPTIDLISIGIVAEDGRKYYAISKDFNLEEAWNRWQPKTGQGNRNNIQPIEYWIRENVLKSIWEELCKWDEGYFFKNGDYFFGKSKDIPVKGGFNFKTLKKLISKYGKSNKQIAEEVKDFIDKCECFKYTDKEVKGVSDYAKSKISYKPEFYGYYADYDWVVFCWLFGRMIDLPKGLPMFAFDIQQQIEEYKIDKELLLKEVPQINSHNSLSDAFWNKKAYEWIQNKISNEKG